MRPCAPVRRPRPPPTGGYQLWSATRCRAGGGSAPAPDEAEAAEAFAAAAGAEEALVPPAAGGLGERLAALLEPASRRGGRAPGGPAAGRVAGRRPGRGDGRGLFGRRRLARHRQGASPAGCSEVGVPVVGVDSLRYFWSERTPEQPPPGSSRRSSSHYRRAWNRPRGRPDRLLLRRRHAAVPLQPAAGGGPCLRRAHRAARALGECGLRDPRHRLARRRRSRRLAADGTGAGTAADGPGAVLLRRGGAGDRLHPGELAGAQIVKMPGGHHFDGDYGKLADMILDGLAR